MRILVTGGGGFLGRHIVNKLLSKNYQVNVFGRKIYPDLVSQGVNCYTGDLTDPKSLSPALENCQGVIHTAALAGLWGKRSDYFSNNVLGTQNIINSCLNYKIRYLVYTSTPSVVYSSESIIAGDESLPYSKKFLTYYAWSKALAEQFVLQSNCDDLYTCSLRPHLIFGPGDTHIIPTLINRAKAGRLKIIGRANNLVSVCYVENAADAHICALEKLATSPIVRGKSYFINEESPVNCWSFINTILSNLSLNTITRRIPFRVAYSAGFLFELFYGLINTSALPPLTRFMSLQLSTDHWFKITKAQKELLWEPRIDLPTAINNTVAYFSD